MNDKSRALWAQVGIWEWCAAALAALTWALTWGFNYGVDNQPVYLLQALRLNDPSLLTRDWYAAEVTHYHPAFSYLAAPLLRWSPAGWGIGLALTVVATVGTLGWYGVLRRVERSRVVALSAFFLVVALMITTQTLSIATSYIFNQTFQPSALGAMGLLLAVGPFLAGRWLTSGVMLACSGLFHANYLVLNVAAFGLVHLFIGGSFKLLVRRLCLQLGPSLIPLLILAGPMLSTVSVGDTAEAQRILFQIRAPHHYVPRAFQRDLVLPAAWLVLGLVSSSLLPRTRALHLARLWLLAASAVVWLPTLLTSFVYWSRVAQLFVWRLAPFVDLLAQSLFCIAVVRLAGAPRLWRRFSLAEMGCFAVSLLALGSAYALRDLPEVGGVLLLGLVLAALGAGVQRWLHTAARSPHGSARNRNVFRPVRRAALLVTSAALLGNFAWPLLAALRQNSNLLSGQPAVERELLDFVAQNTARDALFLSPPEHRSFRFLSERAIVVDWKSSPMLPAEVIEWHRRLKDVTGRNFNGMGDLDGYRDITVARAKTLRSRYGFDYVLLLRGSNRGWQAQPVVFQNARYVLYDARAL